jgi:hypothetical protein
VWSASLLVLSSIIVVPLAAGASPAAPASTAGRHTLEASPEVAFECTVTPDAPSSGPSAASGDRPESSRRFDPGNFRPGEVQHPAFESADEPARPVLWKSISNKILEVEDLESPIDGALLLIEVGTEITDFPEGKKEPCQDRTHVVFRMDAESATDAMAEETIRRAAAAAKLGPFRAVFTIVEDECVVPPGLPSSAPVAVGLRIVTGRP